MTQKDKIIPPRWSYTPPADVVPPEVWTHGREKQALSPSKTMRGKPGTARKTQIPAMVNDDEIMMANDLLVELRGRSLAPGTVTSRGSLLVFLLQTAHAAHMRGGLEKHLER